MTYFNFKIPSSSACDCPSLVIYFFLFSLISSTLGLLWLSNVTLMGKVQPKHDGMLRCDTDFGRALESIT